MYDFFNQLLGYVEMFFQYLSNFAMTLIYAMQMITTAIALPKHLIVSLPWMLGSAIVIFLAVYVVKFFVGR